MITDLSSKSIKQLRRMSPGHDDLLHDCVTGEAADELARRLEEAQQRIADLERGHEVAALAHENRIGKHLDTVKELEEAQQKIVAQQARIDEVLVIFHELLHDRFPVNVDEILRRPDDLSALAAHDAEIKAEAKAEALEELQVTCSAFGIELPRIVDKAAAEYRAKAGRKE